jgi:FkbM family methyltransferase
VNRRDFLIGAASGASSAVVLGVAGRAVSGTMAGETDAPLPDVPTPAPPPTLYQGRRSFAQQGEDLVLYNLLCQDLKIQAPTYLDIGAGDPVLSNNTYALYLTGSRGVLVEPNPTLVRKLKAVRPGDIVIGCGVGLKEASAADYYVIRGRWPLNTFSREAVAEYRRQSAADPVERVLKMPLIPINLLIADLFGSAPDLLSIDVEGLDLAVLRTLDTRAHRPAVICAETKGPGMSHDRTPIARFLRGRGYEACAGSLYNTIFVDRSRL